MNLTCWNDWQPLLTTPQGQTWFRPIALLGEDDYSAEQNALTVGAVRYAPDPDWPSSIETRDDRVGTTSGNH